MAIQLHGVAIFVAALLSSNGSLEQEPLTDEAVLPNRNLSLPFVLAQAISELPPERSDDTEEAREKLLWSGTIEAGIQIRQGNTDTVDVYGKGEALRKSDKQELVTTVSFDYAQRDAETSRNRAFAQSVYRAYRWDSFYLSVVLNLEHDEIENLDLRLNATAGPGYKIMDTEDSKLLAEVGAGVSAEFLDTKRDGDKRQTEGILRVHGQWLTKVFDRSTFSEELSIYPSMSRLGTFRLISRTSLTTPLSESLDLRISLVDEYDNDPEVTGVKKNDLTFRTALVFRF